MTMTTKKEIQRRILGLIEEGLNLENIAAKLNAEGLKTPKGAEWRTHTVSYYSRWKARRKRRPLSVDADEVRETAEPTPRIQYKYKLPVIVRNTLQDVRTSNLRPEAKIYLSELLLGTL